MMTFPIGLAAIALAILPAGAEGGEPFRFPEGHHGKGELRYVKGIPVLSLAGTPEEMGAQAGVLAVKPAGALLARFRRFLDEKAPGPVAALLRLSAGGLLGRFPEEQRRELDALIAASGAERELVVLANTIFDLEGLLGCSGILVAGSRSATGGPLYGRNFDFPFDAMVAEYGLVVAVRPEGKKAFAMVSFPGLLASNAGINEDGLTMGANTVRTTGDGAPPFDLSGLPYTAAARTVMETCESVAEFDRWIRASRRTAMGILLAADRNRQAVFEVTTRNVSVRDPEAGLVWATNHFRAPPMAAPKPCWRYDRLARSREIEKLSVADVARLLHDANQGTRTIQTMVFEPARLVLHLSIGRGPASARPLAELDLRPFLVRTPEKAPSAPAPDPPAPPGR